MKLHDKIWLAGLLEGEGYFGWHKRKHYYGQPIIGLTMTDEDVVQRAAKLMNINVFELKRRTKLNKRAWRAQTFSNKAVPIMKAILPYMGARRTAKITELLAKYEARPGFTVSIKKYWAKKTIEERQLYTLPARRTKMREIA